MLLSLTDTIRALLPAGSRLAAAQPRTGSHIGSTTIQLEGGPPNIGLGHLYEALESMASFSFTPASGQNDQFTNPDLMFRSRDSLIQCYAEETVRHLMQIPATSNDLNFQSLPVLAAGSELTGSKNLCETGFVRDSEPCIR